MAEDLIQITVCYSAQARQCQEITLQVPAQSLLFPALTASGALEFLGICAPAESLQYGVWNTLIKAPEAHCLQDGDRIEIYRPLRVDPMTARRERFKKQGARSAGLFAQRRPGGKPGY